MVGIDFPPSIMGSGLANHEVICAGYSVRIVNHGVRNVDPDPIPPFMTSYPAIMGSSFADHGVIITKPEVIIASYGVIIDVYDPIPPILRSWVANPEVMGWQL